MNLWKWLLSTFFVLSIGVAFTYLALYALIGTVAYLIIKPYIKGELQCK